MGRNARVRKAQSAAREAGRQVVHKRRAVCQEFAVLDEQRPTAALTESTKLLCLAQATNLTGLARYFCRKKFSRLILVCLGELGETSVCIGLCLSKTLVVFPLLEGVPRCAEPLTYYTDHSCNQGLPLASVYPFYWH